jgi:hypothetical protein
MIDISVGIFIGNGTTAVAVTGEVTPGTFIANLYNNYKLSAPGDMLEKSDVDRNVVVSLVFNTEAHMLNVVAALTQQTFEVVDSKYKAFLAKKEKQKELNWRIVESILDASL